MDNPSAELDQNHLRSQLANAIALRSAEDQVLWMIFGTFWATNAILLVALFTSGNSASNATKGIVIAGVGCVLSSVWYFIQGRALGHVKIYEDLMHVLEEALRLPQHFAVSGRINRPIYEKNMPKGPRARTLMQLCSMGGVIIWGLAILIFVIC